MKKGGEPTDRTPPSPLFQCLQDREPFHNKPIAGLNGQDVGSSFQCLHIDPVICLDAGLAFQMDQFSHGIRDHDVLKWDHGFIPDLDELLSRVRIDRDLGIQLLSEPSGIIDGELDHRTHVIYIGVIACAG